MIQFKCPSCQNVLRAGEDRAGAAVACPKCKTRLKVPTPKAQPSPSNKKPTQDEIEEVVPEDFDDEDVAPRKKTSKRPDEDADLDDEEEDDRPRRRRDRKDREESGKSIVSGVVYILLGLVIAAVGLVAPTMMELQVEKTIPMIFGPTAGVLLAALGIFYIVRN